MIDRTTGATLKLDTAANRRKGQIRSVVDKTKNGSAEASGSDSTSDGNPELTTRTAFVHDWLPVVGGAERVLEQMVAVLPNSEIFTLIDKVSDEGNNFLSDKEVHTSFIQRLPFGQSKYRYFLPLAPMAIEQFDLREFEVVVSSNYAVANGVLTTADQLHLSYTHSPIRYAWDLYFEYMNTRSLRKHVKKALASVALHYVRMFDVLAANRVDGFIANSKHVARRIWKTYRRPSRVVYPPVDTSKFELYEQKEDFYLTLSRLVPYKRIDLIVEAFSEMPGKELIVIGDGPEYDHLESIATPNITMLGYQPNEAVKYYMQRARAFVFAAEEDFGIVPLEAQACGTPVVAYGAGGALETVVPNKTGVFFQEQNNESLQAAIQRFEEKRTQFEAEEIRQHALQFSEERFRREFREAVQEYQIKYKQFGPAMNEGEQVLA